jgi:hypothetical protein
MAGRITSILLALLVLSVGSAAGATTCPRTCGYDFFGSYFCARRCSARPQRVSPRDVRCRRLCRADVRDCRAEVGDLYACRGLAPASRRACRKAAKQAFRRCRAEATNTCAVWLSRPRSCPQVFLGASAVQRLPDLQDPAIEYVLVDVILEARGIASIGYLEPGNFSLIAAGEEQDRFPLIGLAGPEYCPESMSLPEDGTLGCRLAFQIPAGTASAAIEFAFFPYLPTASIEVPAAGR